MKFHYISETIRKTTRRGATQIYYIYTVVKISALSLCPYNAVPFIIELAQSAGSISEKVELRLDLTV